MADPVGVVVADVVIKHCTSHTCPYRYGDSESIKKKLSERLTQKVKHRLADGNEVRVLETRIAVLEKALKSCLTKATSGTVFTKSDLDELKKVLGSPKKK
jgi:hypothetical protein